MYPSLSPLTSLKPWLFSVLLALAVPLPAAADEPPSPAAETASQTVIADVSGTVQTMIQEQKIAGAVVLVQHQGKILHAEAQGHRDVESQSPMALDTLFRIYSMTKPITSVAVLMLVEEGRIDLDAPVELYLEELAGLRVYRSKLRSTRTKRSVTVRDLLRHTSGMTYGFFGDGPVDQLYMENHPLDSANLTEMMAKVGDLPLLHQPGEAFTYGISTDVLGALVERVSEMPFEQFLQERLFGPLGMVDTRFHAPDSSRLASVYEVGGALHEAAATSDFRKEGRLASGGGGLVSTAGDYLKFCRMLLNNGTIDGQQFLRSTSIEAMTENQLPPGVSYAIGRGFGLGVDVHLQAEGAAAHRGQYGWNGIASTHFWISPEDELVVIALSQRWPFSTELKDLLAPIVYNAIAN